MTQYYMGTYLFVEREEFYEHEVAQGFIFMATLFPELQSDIKPAGDNVEKLAINNILNDVLNGAQDIKRNNDSIFPKQTPEKYKEAFVEYIDTKGVPMVKIFIPAISEDPFGVTEWASAFSILMISLLGYNLRSIMQIDASSKESFNNIHRTSYRVYNTL